MSVDIKTRSFVSPLTDDCRLRHHHRRIGKTIVQFVIQLEVRHPKDGTWLPVVRYDTAHGFAHRDRLHPDGRSEKTALPVQDYAQALNYAETELKEQWQMYRDRFAKELQHEE